VGDHKPAALSKVELAMGLASKLVRGLAIIGVVAVCFHSAARETKV
jgi:hypothetical protein